MARREQFSTNFKCPNCKNSGSALWEENENPVYGNGLNRELVSVSDGFCVTTGAKQASDTEIVCTECNIEVED